ncbi:hypothetical protein WA026_014113 [Henosepilachna vigintioctopunctata]|uniref:Uncharacterized protein n=1 Tax=Henosepilachna vigintioctopunctata TaxID=420089 RepID=A0AAW1TSP6_9CUCU
MGAGMFRRLRLPSSGGGLSGCAVLLRQLSCSERWGSLAEETKRIKGHLAISWVGYLYCSGNWVRISSQFKLAQEILAADAGVVPLLPSDLSCVQRGGAQRSMTTSSVVFCVAVDTGYSAQHNCAINSVLLMIAADAGVVIASLLEHAEMPAE